MNIPSFNKYLLAIIAMVAFSLAANANFKQAVVSDIDHTGMGTFSGVYLHANGQNADHPWFVFNANAGDVITLTVNTPTWNKGSFVWVYTAPDGCVEIGDYAPYGTLEQLSSQPGPDQADGFIYTQAYTIATTGQYTIQLDSRASGSGAYVVTIAGSTAQTVLCNRRTRVDCDAGLQIANANFADTDVDGQTDLCDTDDDNDGVPDLKDSCPLLAHADQLDTDGDGQGDACDLDDDNDGIADNLDCAPLDAKNDKVLVCNGGKTICVSQNAADAHVENGGSLGACFVSPAIAQAAPSTALQQDVVAGVEFAVFPNPNNGAFTVRLNHTRAGQSEVLILDAKGSTVERRLVQLSGSGQTIGINLKNKKSGIYLVKVTSGGFVQTTQLTVQ